MECILDDCEELIEKERKQREEFERTGFQPDCKRCSHHNYDGPDYKVCLFDHNPKHCGSYRELDRKGVFDRAENIAEKINRLYENLDFMEAMEEEYKSKKPTEEDRKFVADYFGIPRSEKDEVEYDEEDDEEEFEEDSFQLPRKMR